MNHRSDLSSRNERLTNSVDCSAQQKLCYQLDSSNSHLTSAEKSSNCNNTFYDARQYHVQQYFREKTDCYNKSNNSRYEYDYAPESRYSKNEKYREVDKSKIPKTLNHYPSKIYTVKEKGISIEYKTFNNKGSPTDCLMYNEMKFNDTNFYSKNRGNPSTIKDSNCVSLNKESKTTKNSSNLQQRLIRSKSFIDCSQSHLLTSTRSTSLKEGDHKVQLGNSNGNSKDSSGTTRPLKISEVMTLHMMENQEVFKHNGGKTTDSHLSYRQPNHVTDGNKSLSGSSECFVKKFEDLSVLSEFNKYTCNTIDEKYSDNYKFPVTECQKDNTEEFNAAVPDYCEKPKLSRSKTCTNINYQPRFVVGENISQSRNKNLQKSQTHHKLPFLQESCDTKIKNGALSVMPQTIVFNSNDLKNDRFLVSSPGMKSNTTNSHKYFEQNFSRNTEISYARNKSVKKLQPNPKMSSLRNCDPNMIDRSFSTGFNSVGNSNYWENDPFVSSYIKPNKCNNRHQNFQNFTKDKTIQKPYENPDKVSFVKSVVTKMEKQLYSRKTSFPSQELYPKKFNKKDHDKINVPCSSYCIKNCRPEYKKDCSYFEPKLNYGQNPEIKKCRAQDRLLMRSSTN